MMRSPLTPIPETSMSWGVAGLVSELSTAEPKFLSRAQSVLGPWMNGKSARPVSSWRVSRSNESGWLVESESDSTNCETMAEAIRLVEFGAVHACIMSCRQLSIHGALLCKDGMGVMIAGSFTSGKSTLACALWRSGWSLICDDVTLIDTETLLASALPRRISVRHGSRDLLGQEFWSAILATPACDQSSKGYLFHPHEVSGQKNQMSTRLHRIILLGRESASALPAIARRVEPADALMELLPQSNFATVHGAGPAIKALQPIAQSIPAYEMGRGELTAMVQGVEQLVQSEN